MDHPTNEKVDTCVDSRNKLEASGRKGKYRFAIYTFIRTKGYDGATCDEIEVALNLSHQTASGFITVLKKETWVKDSGFRRQTRLGRKAIVWVITKPYEKQGTFF